MRKISLYIREKMRWLAFQVFSPLIGSIADVALEERVKREMANARNPLNKSGSKYFSQNEEDGITLEIIRRLGIKRGTFIEIGVGDGLENNSIILLASGWKGIWLGGQDLALSIPQECRHFSFLKRWIDRENVVSLIGEGLETIGNPKEIDFFSLDIDGYDLFVLENLLKAGFSAKMIVVEYNGKFPPPIEWTVPYDKGHMWMGDDYQGASLSCFCKLLTAYGYKLVCCNVTGSNAFFVREEFASLFADVPSEISDIFYPAFSKMYYMYGQPKSPRTVEEILRRGCAPTS